MRFTVTTFLGGLAGLVLVSGGAPAGAASSCRHLKEHTGCALANASYKKGDSSFLVHSGVGEAAAFGTVNCGGQSRNVIYGSYPQLQIKRPKIGRKYTRTLPIDQQPSAGLTDKGSVVLKVDIVSAKKTTIDYEEHLTETANTGSQTSTSTCEGSTKATLKRTG